MFGTNKRKYSKYLTWIIKLSIISIAVGYIYYRVSHTNNWESIYSFWTKTWTSNTSRHLLYFAFILVPVNWSLEALKWKQLIRRVEKFSFIKSLKATMAGVTASVFTPNRTGEFAGRMLFVKSKNRLRAIVISMVCSIAQLLITTTIGFVALIAFIHNQYGKDLSTYISYIAIIGVIVMLSLAYLFYYQLSLLKRILRPLLGKWKAFRKALSLLDRFSSNDYSITLFYSLIRFGTYCIQYFCLLEFFQSQLTIAEYTTLIPVNFLGITAIPSIALAELGVREAVALSFFSVTSTPSITVVSATFTLWLINVAIPALIGTFFIATAPFKFKRND